MTNKITAAILCIFALSSSYTQQEYFFKGLYSNYCYNGNKATNSAKKITVNLENTDGPMFKVASIGCTRETKLTELSAFLGSEKVYYSEKEKRGIIIEDENNLHVFAKKDGEVKVIATAHTDKKEAKQLDVKIAQGKYAKVLMTLEEKLSEAEAKAKHAEMIAAIYKIPEGNYTDKFNFSGVYYLSEISDQINYGASGKKKSYISGVNIEFVYDKRLLRIHYGPDKIDYASFREEMQEMIDNGSMDAPIKFSSSSSNLIRSLKSTTLTRIEDGLFFVHSSSKPYINVDCDKPEWNPHTEKGVENHFILLGKDTNRIKELMADPEKVQELTINATIKDCEYWNTYREVNNPMPKKGMSDSKLQAEVSQAAKSGAASRGWKEEIIYAYVKSKEWFTLRNKVTGIITGRELAAIVIMRSDNGKYKWEQVVFRENFDGAEYGKPYWNGNSQRIYPVSEKEAMKYK